MIQGLSKPEADEYEWLTGRLVGKRSRNLLRASYMDGKHMLRRLPPTAPPYLRDIKIVLGWPAKAVEMLARRIRLEGFALPGGDITQYEIPALLEKTGYFAMVQQAQVSALVHSTVFAIVHDAGQVSFVTALDGTGRWDPAERRFTSFLRVVEWDREKIRPKTAVLILPGRLITIDDGQAVSRVVNPSYVPVVQMPYKPRLDRPFGSSRISRAVMSLTDSAVRTVLRSEGTADFYGAPWFMIFGPDEEAFSKGSWQMIMDRVNAIPDNEDSPNPRADVKQFSQASQQPHVDQLQVLAGLFAGETNIPVSSLGVGIHQDNPTSAESYLASREDMIAEAEDAQATWGWAHRQVACWVWQAAHDGEQIPDELNSLVPVWRDARFTSRAAAADAAVKLVSVFPWMAQSETIVSRLGFDAETTSRLLAEKRRGEALTSLQDLMGGTDSADNLDQ